MSEEGQRTEMEEAFLANQERRQRKPSGASVATHTVSAGEDNPGPLPEFDIDKEIEKVTEIGKKMDAESDKQIVGNVKKKHGIFGL